MDKPDISHQGKLWIVKRKKKGILSRPPSPLQCHCVLRGQFLQFFSHEGGSFKKQITIANTSVEILIVKRVTKVTPTLHGFIFTPSLKEINSSTPNLSNLSNLSADLLTSSPALTTSNPAPVSTNALRGRNRSNTIGITETVNNATTSRASPTNMKIELIVPYSFFTNSEAELMEWVSKLAQASAIFTSLEPLPQSMNLKVQSLLPASITSKPLPSPRAAENNNNNNNNDINNSEEMRKHRMLRGAAMIERFIRMSRPRRYFKTTQFNATRLQCFARFFIQRRSYLNMVKENKYRKRVIDELLSTETSYIDGLSVLVNSYIKPLTPGQAGSKIKKKSQTILNQNQIVTLFSNVESILQLHQFLKSSLDKRMSDWFPNQRLGDVFQSLAAQFKLYTQYINNYDKAVALYTELIDPSNRHLKFTKFCNEVEQQFVGAQTGLKLNSFLILPVQRLPRYEMLLRDITRHTWKSHPDLPSLSNALTAITEVTAFLNESKRTNENMSRMMAIRNKLAGQTVQDLDLLQPHRRMIREGPVIQHFPNGKSRERYLFLFSDLLLLSDEMLVRKLSKIAGTINYNTKYMVFFAAKKLDVIDLGDTKFYVKSRDGSTDCLFEVELKEKAQWISDFHKCLEAYKFD